MANNKQYQQVSGQTQDSAMKMAKATQRPGQTKEQTKLIAQGIEKGIGLYKKQQKEKSRELNKKLNKVSRQMNESKPVSDDKPDTVTYKQSKVAWGLLVTSWIGFACYIFVI